MKPLPTLAERQTNCARAHIPFLNTKKELGDDYEGMTKPMIPFFQKWGMQGRDRDKSYENVRPQNADVSKIKAGGGRNHPLIRSF